MKIYPVDFTMPRKITQEEQKRIKESFKRKDKKQLISILLNLEKFPIDDPYIGFSRRSREALNKNPKTVRRIGKRLLNLGLNGILSGASKPKSPSRQLGQMFRKWLPKLGYPILPQEDFLKYKGTAILKGGDFGLKKFAKDELNYRGQKGIDIVLKAKDRFVIGEAKFITASGGGQDKGFREAIAFIKHKKEQAYRIAILDGVVWLVPNKIKMKKKKKLSLYESILRLNKNQIALSVLLLKDFIKDLSR